MKNAMEMIEALWYKFQMFGVQIDGPRMCSVTMKLSVRTQRSQNQH
jgi:hypothetical protein